MLILFEKNEKSFDSLGLGVLTDFTSNPIIVENLNGNYYLEFNYLINGNLYKLLEVERIIKESTTNQLFVIEKLTSDSKAKTVRVYGRHIALYLMSKNFLVDVYPKNLDSAYALQWIIDRASTPLNLTVIGDTIHGETARYVRKNLLDCVYNESNSILKLFGGEIKFNNFNITLNQKRSTIEGYELRKGKNIQGITIDVDFSSVVTRLIPQGKNELLLDELFVDSPLIQNYSTISYKKIEFNNIGVETDDEQNITKTEEQAKQELISECNKLFENGLDKPTISIKVDFIELSKTNEYKDYSFLETLDLGATVTVVYDQFKIETQVIKTEYDCAKKRFTKLELGSITPNIANATNEAISQIKEIDERTISNTVEIYKSDKMLSSTIKEVKEDLSGFKTETSTAFEQTAESISSKASKDNIISEINQSAEKIQIKSKYLDLEGQITISSLSSEVTSKLNDKSTLVHNFTGTGGRSGYVAFATITIKGTYQNSPISMNISNRGQETSTLTFAFTNSSSNDPSVAHIRKLGEINFWIQKTATSTWRLIAQKSEVYDSFGVFGVNKSNYMGNTTITWTNTHLDSLPTGCTQASYMSDSIGKWCYENDKTVIDGGKIATGTITADKISVNSLQAISAKIGGYTIDDFKLYGSKVGMCSERGHSAYAFWAGGGPLDAPYRVGHAGELIASNASISGTVSSSTIIGSTLRLEKTGSIDVRSGDPDKIRNHLNGSLMSEADVKRLDIDGSGVIGPADYLIAKDVLSGAVPNNFTRWASINATDNMPRIEVGMSMSGYGRTTVILPASVSTPYVYSNSISSMTGTFDNVTTGSLYCSENIYFGSSKSDDVAVRTDGPSSGKANYAVTYLTYYPPGSKHYIHASTRSAGTFGIDVWPSDKRLKHGITDTKINNALDIINNIKHREFYWNMDGSIEELGYIADEIEQLIPKAVFKVGELKTKQISQTTLIPYLSKAIQELYGIVKIQQEEIELLKLEIGLLKGGRCDGENDQLIS